MSKIPSLAEWRKWVHKSLGDDYVIVHATIYNYEYGFIIDIEVCFN